MSIYNCLSSDHIFRFFEEGSTVSIRVFDIHDPKALIAKVDSVARNMITPFPLDGEIRWTRTGLLFDQSPLRFNETLNLPTTISASNPENVAVLDDLGKKWESLAEYDEAMKFYKQSLQLREEIKDAELSSSYHHLGCLTYLLCKYESAIHYFEKELTLLTGKTLERALALCNLAKAKSWLNDLHEVGPLYQEALDLYGEILQVELHPDIGHLYHIWGRSFILDGQYSNAIDQLEIAFTMLPENSYEMEEVQTALGFAYQCTKELGKAMDCHQRALANLEKLSNHEPHLSKIEVLTNIGDTWILMKEYEEAEECYQKALTMLNKFFGDRHHVLAARAHNNLGVAYKALKKSKEAKAEFDKAFQTYLILLGEKHPHTRNSAKKNPKVI